MIPRVEITENGPVAPSRAAIEAGLWNMLRDAFGQDLNEDPRTPQGQLVTSWTAALMEAHNSQIEMLNQFDPRYAFGAYQEGLGAIYFQSRRQATKSVVSLEFTGLSGTLVPVGFVVIDASGNEWRTNGDIRIGAGGTGSVQASCVIAGRVIAAADTITTFKETIDGLDRVTNPAPAVPGNETESRLDFELRRIRSVTANAKLTNNAVEGAVLNLPGVIDVYVTDNPTADDATVGETNYPMPQHSLLVSVVGGEDRDVAIQVLTKGGTGCTLVGNTLYNYVDTGNETAVTHPEYAIRFERPEHVITWFKITVPATADVSIESENAMKQSIIDQFSAGENRARIGGMVIGSSFICGLARELRVIDIEVSLDGTTWERFLNFGVDQFPVTDKQYISLVGL